MQECWRNAKCWLSAEPCPGMVKVNTGDTGVRTIAVADDQTEEAVDDGTPNYMDFFTCPLTMEVMRTQ